MTLVYKESSYISLSDRYVRSINRCLINNFLKEKTSLTLDAVGRIELGVRRLEFRSLLGLRSRLSWPCDHGHVTEPFRNSTFSFKEEG